MHANPRHTMFNRSLAACFLLVTTNVWLVGVSAQGWTSPYFVDAQTPNISFSTRIDSINNITRHVISMDEEIPTRFKLITINYAGPGVPIIKRFIFGLPGLLECIITRVDNQYAIFVENRQDYENVQQQRYEILVAINGDTSATTEVPLLINTNNIFDNDPILSYVGQCSARELAANLDTGCRFTVQHPDGITNSSLTMVASGSNGEERKFAFNPILPPEKFVQEYTLIVREELVYKTDPMYSFNTTVRDVADHTMSIPTLLQVVDVPNEPPIWTVPFATARFDEKTEQTFRVAAIDGDTGINVPIWYKLQFAPAQNYADILSIQTETGIIEVKSIDRDARNQEVFPFSIVAYKSNNESWTIEANAVIIVDDINDNQPIVSYGTTVIRILENTYLTLPIQSLWVNDLDLGEHATYTVHLDSPDSSQTTAEPFLVIPDKGYKEANFTITVADTTLLDYEDLDWQNFTITLVARETFNVTHIGSQVLRIELINWNDELPIFDSINYEISINETTGNAVELIVAHASDRDINDAVVYHISGPDGIGIDTNTGVISTTMDGAFDYDRQKQVIVQITANDTLITDEVQRLHTAYAQLTINLIDVNNQTPELRMPRGSPRMDENEPGGYIVTKDGIIATDPDTTADLKFEIVWTDSYATKAGQEAPAELYHNCFIIRPDTSDKNRVIGYLEVNPDFAPLLIDYEEYEVIYLTIRVTDFNQTINEGSSEAVLTIRINDLNDNAPQFIQNTLTTIRTVIEEAQAKTLVGTVLAEDIDGPQFNKITYSISPLDGTPSDWVTINSVSGELLVADGITIGCDIPRRDGLLYTVTIADTEWETTGIINITIIDINNQTPEIGTFDGVIYLYENITTGEHIQTVSATDADRDAPHNVVQYLINYANFPILGSYFEIGSLTGRIQARLVGGAYFDRDRGEKSFEIHVDVRDNYQGNGNTNANNLVVKLILLDVNDNAPELPSPATFRPTVSENSEVDRLVDTIVAVDIDDESTPNAKVGYRILSVVAGTETAVPAPDPQALFAIDGVTGELKLMQNGTGFYGSWLVQIEAFDHGDEWDSHIRQQSNETYTVTLEPYNFNAPQLVYPTSGKMHRLSYDSQQIGRPLLLADNTPIPLFTAIDDDGGIYGNIVFTMVDTIEGSHDVDSFDIVAVDNKSAQLYLKRPIEAKFYRLNIRAEDGGGRRSDLATNVVLVFVDMTGEPVFNIQVFNTNFTENVTGLSETRLLPAAEDPKNVGIDDPQLQSEIFYFIDPTFEDGHLFQVDPESRLVSLTQELDRESIDLHRFRVIATNRRDGPQGTIDGNSYLIVEVTVNDVNDNPPAFEYPSYGSGITVNDAIGKVVLTVKATDPDLDDEIRYAIQSETISGVGENLAAVLTTPFDLHPTTGALSLNFAVSADMKGYILLQVQAFDLLNHTDTTNVKIYIISESNRVTFQFSNDKETVDLKRERIAIILSEHYEFECNIDDITRVTNTSTQPQLTNMRAHFIKDNEAIESTIILSRSNVVIFIARLKEALRLEGIYMEDLRNNQQALNDDSAREQAVQIGLIVVSTLLGIILLALITFYTLRIRNLNRQLRAFSAPVYEPDEKSFRPPTTNEFATENSNPVLSKGGAAGFDQNRAFDDLSLISESSDDSEFAGINNDPTFMQSGKTTGANIAVINGFNHQQLADHSNGFGWESSTDNNTIKKDSKASEDELYKF